MRPPSEQPNATYPIATAQSDLKNQADKASEIDPIEKVDMEDAISEVFLRESGAKSLEEACKDTYAGSKGKYIDDVDAQYGDLDGDGRKEAAVTALSCMAGTGGPDLFAVFKLDASGKVGRMSIEPLKSGELFKGKDIYQGLRGKMRVLIEEGTLIEQYPIFKKGDANCCATGGVRQLVYKWNGRALELSLVLDTAEPKGD